MAEDNQRAGDDAERNGPPCRVKYRTLRFSAVAGSYALGAFNENYFKEAALLIAVGSGKVYLQGWATVVVTLPYLLLAAAAGWLADRFVRRRVMIGAKLFEIFAMSTGALGLLVDNWTLILLAGAMMATLSTVFSPSLNGTIPDVFCKRQVNHVNAAVKIFLMACSIAGVAVAGFALGRGESAWAGVPAGRILVAVPAVAMTVVGFLVSLGGPACPPANPDEKFPWTGPAHTVRKLWGLRKDPFLLLVIATDVFIWSVGWLEILVINKLGLLQFRAGTRLTGLMIFAELLGFGVGGLTSGLAIDVMKGYRFFARFLAGLACSLALMPAVTLLWAGWQIPAAFVVLVCVGIFGGLILVPCESFIQVRPPAKERGSVIAASNFSIFSGILLSGPLANLLNATTTPTNSFAVMAAMAAVMAVAVHYAVRRIRREE